MRIVSGLGPRVTAEGDGMKDGGSSRWVWRRLRVVSGGLVVVAHGGGTNAGQQGSGGGEWFAQQMVADAAD